MLTSSDLSTSLMLQGSWIQRCWRSEADSFHMGLATAVGYQAQAGPLSLGYHQLPHSLVPLTNLATALEHSTWPISS